MRQIDEPLGARRRAKINSQLKLHDEQRWARASEQTTTT